MDGPATIIKVTYTYVIIKCSNNKIKLLNVSHIKHFILEKSALKANVYPDDDDFELAKKCVIPPNFDFFNYPLAL